MFYNFFFIPFATLFIKVYGLFNPKLRLREKSWKQSLTNQMRFKHKDKRVWFHAASMGEFEQAKPIIELFKKRHEDVFVIVSFFSPSGYENQKNYKYADAICYMPFDRLKNVRYFLNTINPDLAIFIRYEIWRNFLQELKVRKIPVYLINATKPDSKFLTGLPILRSFTKNNYHLFSKIFTVDNEQTKFFNSFGVNPKLTTLSDTRFDRIAEKVEESSKHNIIPQEYFSGDQFVLVLGSSWQPDEEIVFEAVKKWNENNDRKIKLIAVPHEPTQEHIKKAMGSGLDFLLLSELENFAKNNSIIEDKKHYHILVDSIGKLLNLYSYADAAYIGGAFGAGVHSVTEPAGYGIPLASGTGMGNSPDAIKLEEIDALTVINSSVGFYAWLDSIISNKDIYDEKARKAKEYITSRLGSSQKIYEQIISDLKV
jgi:3-deoxy-D-manno-octulosonic-acid transferase